MENELHKWFGKHALPVESKAQIKGKFNQLLSEFQEGTDPVEVYYYRSSWGSLNNLKSILQLRFSWHGKYISTYCNFSESALDDWYDCLVLAYKNGDVHILCEAGTRGYLKEAFTVERRKARGSKLLEDYFL